MVRKFATAALLAAGCSVFAFHSAALAADAAPPAPDPGDNEEILVTAQKIEQRLVDVPITISVMTNDRMRTLGVNDLDELSNYVPGLNIQEQSANNPGIVIRGITSDSGSAQQAARVTLYYNGVDISRSRGAYQGVYDVDRIEVVKGPQATLFGTAATVGAISIVSARPKPGLSASLTGGVGNYDQRLLSGYLNAGSDVIAGRVAFEWKKRDGYVKNFAPDQRDLNGQDEVGVRGSLRFTPSSDFTADLIFTYDREHNPGTAFVSKRLPPASVNGSVYQGAWLGGSPYSEQVLGAPRLGLNRHVYDGNLTLNWNMGDGWSFTTVNGYRKFDSLEIFDADGSRAWFLEFAEGAKGWQFNHESRFAYASDKFRGSFGWNVFTEKGDQYVPFSSEEGTFLQCAANVIPGLGCIAADGTVTASRATALLTRGKATVLPYSGWFENKGNNQSYSMFADGTWLPTEQLELTAGVRVLIEKRRSGYASYAPKSVLTGGPLIPSQMSTNGNFLWAQRSYSAVLPRFNALYHLTPDVSLYATISKGRRSPTVDVSAAASAGGAVAAVNLIPEENVWNYEGGIKGRVGIISGSLGVYYQKYDNFQVSVRRADGSTVTESAGSASNLGVEAELEAQFTRWFRAFGNAGFIDGGIDDKPSNGRFAGNQFRLQPRWQASAGFTIDAPLGNDMRVFATPSITYRSRIYFELPNTPDISQDKVTLANVRAGMSFAGDRYEVSAFARNLFNRHYLLDAGNTGGSFGYPTFIPAEPRLYGVQLSARF